MTVRAPARREPPIPAPCPLYREDVIRFDFLWPMAEMIAWGNARLAGDVGPLPPRLDDRTWGEDRFVDASGKTVASSVEDWYGHLARQRVQRLWLLPHRWPVSGEALEARPREAPSIWSYQGHEAGFRRAVWRARLADVTADPSQPPLDRTLRLLRAELDPADAVRKELGLFPHRRARRMLEGKSDDQLTFLPRLGYSIEARRLAEAAITLHGDTFGKVVEDTGHDTPEFRALQERLDPVWRAALLAAVNQFDPAIVD
ncbi:MAG: hypothetical protein E6G40_12100 [Actinobacteria bacterium]|nr:MAG: hypothetical protein E6G40_12100 [Actinomycetota bacterium]